jgi:tRNA threonylcarbamoyladenosine biosynthesis protein TsaE
MRVPLKELDQFAGNVLAAIWLEGVQERATVVALKGDLGTGKTTFVQALCKRLGIKEIVQSPTYVLMKTYPLEGALTTFGEKRRFNRMVHIDAYRLEKPGEFSALQPEQFLNDPKALVLVEWPERLGKLLPKPNFTLTFSAGGDEAGERYIEVA